MKLLKYIGLYSLIVWLILSLYPAGNIVAIDAEPHVDIATSAPNGRLFEVSDLKRGDWATREISVENKGNRDFEYTMSAQFESGDEMFYESLIFKLEQAEDLLYDGQLSEFSGPEKRFLAVSETEDFKLTIHFPFEYGNEYQGLSTDGNDSSDKAEDRTKPNGGKLPKTSVPWYNLLVLAIIGLAGSGAMMWILKNRNNTHSDK